MAAMHAPSASKTGAATALSPTSSSSAAVAKPLLRARSSSASSVERSVIVRLVRAGSFSGRDPLPERQKGLAVRRRVQRRSAPRPVGHPDEVRGLHLDDVDRLFPAADGDVDRLPRLLGQPAERLTRRLHERQAVDGEDAQARQLGPGRETVAVAPDEPARLQDREQAGDGALVEPELTRQLGDPDQRALRAERAEDRECPVG